MRLIAAAAAAGLAPALAATADARPLTVAPPKAVQAAPLLTSSSAVLALSGRATAGTTIALQAPCRSAVCTTTTAADRRGRWKAALSVVTTRTTTAVPVTVNGTRTVTVKVRPAQAPLALAPTTSPSPQLAMIGDSLAEGTAFALPGLLGEFRVSTSSRVSRPLAEGMQLFAATPLPADGPLVVAFSLFTNDHPLNAPLLEAAVRASAARVAGRGCVLWATIVRPPQGRASYAPVNRMLERLGREIEGLAIVPWARQVARHPGWVRRGDRVHGTPTGYQRRAELYADAARQCLSREPAPEGGAAAPTS